MPKRGYDCKLYVGGGLSEVTVARDVNFEGTAGVIDVSSRAGLGWKEKLAGLREWKVSNDNVWVPDSVPLELIESAWMNGTTLAVKFLDAASGQGWSGTAIVTKFGRNEPLEGGVMCSVELEGAGALSREDPA